MSTVLLPLQAAAPNSLLANLTFEPLKFGPPTTRSNAIVAKGTREVKLQPRAPSKAVTSSPAQHSIREETSISSSSTVEQEHHRDKFASHISLAWPDSVSSYNRPAAGLQNPSMACYANATLQILLHTPPVLMAALEHEINACPQRTEKGFCMLCALRVIANKHWAQRHQNPVIVHGNLSRIRKGFSKNRQEDTHEFFRFVTDGLQATEMFGQPKNTPEKVKQSTWVYRTWGGQVRSRVVCSKCQKPSDTFDSFLDISLDVTRGGRPRLVEMLQGFVKEDRLEGDNKYNCENCKAKANATKFFRIAKAPPVLTLHLKRFSVNYNSYSGRARADKNNQFIEYPELIDIAPYMVDTTSSGTKYRLFGVTCHRGVELRFGHYTSYVRSMDDRWYHADDDDVSPVSSQEALSEKTAYLLSYIRVGDETSIKAPISTVVKRKSEDVPPHADKPFKRAAPSSNTSFSSPPGLPTIGPTGSPQRTEFTYRPKKQEPAAFYADNSKRTGAKSRRDRLGPPMPFKHGHSRKPGMIGKMKRRF